MKKLLLLTLILGLVTMSLAQDWEVVKETTMPADVNAGPNAGYFIDTNTGWLVNDEGRVQKTTDGGNTWTTVRDAIADTEDWLDVEFADANVGYAVAGDGEIYKTTDGGANWTLIGDQETYSMDMNALSVVSADIVFVAADDSTLLKTIDGGATFTKADYDFSGEDLDGGIAFCNENVGVVISDANGASTWYTEDGGANWNFVSAAAYYPPGTASTRLYDVKAVGESTIIITGYHYVTLKSTDGGKTYTRIGGLSYGYDRNEIVDIVDENTFLIAGDYLAMTKDGGATFDTLLTGSGQSYEIVDFVDENHGFVCQANGMWKTTADGGATWNSVISWPAISFWGLGVMSEDKIMASGFGGGEISISDDGGKTWSYPSNLATAVAENLYECEFVDETTGFIGGGYGTLKKTTDGGQSFSFVENPMFLNTNKHINAVHVYNSNAIFAGGSSGYVMRSTDGGVTWSDTKVQTGTVYDMCALDENTILTSESSGVVGYGVFDGDQVVVDSLIIDIGTNSMRAIKVRNGVVLVATSNGFIYRADVSDLAGIAEVFAEPDEDDFYDVEFVDDNLVYAVGENGKIYKSEDAGLNWTQVASPVTVTLQKIKLVGQKLIAVGQDGVIISLNMGPAEEPVDGILINEFLASNDSACVDENGDNDDYIELYNASDKAVDVGGLYITDDLEDPTAYEIPATNPELTTIQPGGFLLLWADKESEQGVLHVDVKLSADGEQIGLVQVIGEEVIFIDSLTFGEQTTDISYGRYADGSDNWLAMTPSPGEANYNGITAIDDRETGLPQTFALHQNYPNPFNPTTTIGFDLPKTTNVQITVFNMLGQAVHEISKENMSAGYYNFNFDASKLSSGIYFYSIKAGDFTQYKKMTLLK